MSILPLVNTDVLDQLAIETSQDVVGRLVEMYIQELSENIEAFDKYSDTETELLKALHKAKNSAAMFGAQRLSHLVVNIESRIKTGKAVDSSELDNLVQVANETLLVIKSLIEE